VRQAVRLWRSALRVLSLALVAAALPLPALAGDATQPTSKPGLRISIQHAAASASLEQAPQAPAPDGKAALASPSFFKSKAGLAALAIVAAGTGYAFYSISHDHIPQRPNR
jgi:hypothetical protein